MKSGLRENRLPHREADQFDASFRIITFYDVQTDSTLSRLDVLLNTERSPEDQYNTAFSSSVPTIPSEQHKSYLSVPVRGIISGLAVNMASVDLCKALRDLANAIETHKK